MNKKNAECRPYAAVMQIILLRNMCIHHELRLEVVEEGRMKTGRETLHKTPAFRWVEASARSEASAPPWAGSFSFAVQDDFQVGLEAPHVGPPFAVERTDRAQTRR